MGDIDTDVVFSNAETGRMPTPNKLNLLWRNAKIDPNWLKGQIAALPPLYGIASPGDYIAIGADGNLYKVDAAYVGADINVVGNPTFEVDQRQLGVNGFTVGAGQFVADRWVVSKSGLAASNVVTARMPGGVSWGKSRTSNSQMYVQLAGGPAAPAASDYIQINQTVEGGIASPLIGTPHSLTLWAFCSSAITFAVALRDNPATKSYCAPATITAANVWTQITLPNIPPMTGGNFTNAASTAGYTLGICLAAGANWRTPTPNAWASGSYIGVPTQTNITQMPVNTTLYLAFVQHQPGYVCTAPIPCPFDQNLFACQRYFQKSHPYNIRPGVASGYYAIANTMTAFNGTYQLFCNLRYTQMMAKNPTAQVYHYTTGTAGQVMLWFASTGTIPNASSATNISSVFTSAQGICALTSSGTSTSLAYGLFEWSSDTGW